MQVAGYQMYHKWDEKIAQTDLYLEPDLTGYTTFSFDKSDEIIVRGEEIAKKFKEQIDEIARKQIKRDTKQSIKSFNIGDEITIKEIIIKGSEHHTDTYCLDKLKISTGEVITHKKFIEVINALTATGDFESIYYKLIPVEGGSRVEFEIREKEVSTFLKLGAHYDDLYKTGILVNITKKHLFFKNDFLSADFVIGDNIRYNIDYFLDNGFNWSFGINTRYNSFVENIPMSLSPSITSSEEEPTTLFNVPVDYRDFTTRLYVQTTFNNKLGLRIGVEDKFLKIFTDEIIDGEPERLFFDNSNYINAFANITYDSYNTKYFPKKGFYLETNYIAYLLSPNNSSDNFDPFSQLYGELGYAHTFFDKFTMHFISEAGITIGSNNNTVHNYHLGGSNQNFINTFIPFYGYDVAELNDTSFLRSSLTARYELFKNNYLSFTGNYARLNDDLWNGGDVFHEIKSGYAVGYGLQSIIGPIEVVYSWNPDNKANYWYFNVGFWF